MRRIAPVVAAMAVLVSAAAVLAAASPTPSPSATAHPSVSSTATPKPAASSTPTPSATPAPSSSSSSGAAERSFTAQVQPLQINGSAKVTETGASTGIVTLQISGLLDADRWTVDIDGGTIARPNENVEIAFKSGADVTRLAMDTVRIHLTRTEMAAFLKAQKGQGVVAEVSDGVRLGYAEFGPA